MSHYYTSQYFLATGGYYQCRDRFKRSKKRRSCRSTPTFLGVLPYHNEKGGMCWCDTETSGWMFTPQRSIHLSSFECLNQRLTDVTRTLDSKMANPKYFLVTRDYFCGDSTFLCFVHSPTIHFVVYRGNSLNIFCKDPCYFTHWWLLVVCCSSTKRTVWGEYGVSVKILRLKFPKQNCNPPWITGFNHQPASL